MLSIQQHGTVSEINLNYPPANAMDTEFVKALRSSLAEVAAGEAKAVVISGRPGMFSGGIDVPGLLPQPREVVLEFWTEFLLLMRDVAACPVPVVAAMTGHSPAGGGVLAIHCDYRIAAAGDFKIGLNEVQVGLPVPASILRVFAFVVGERQAQKLAMQGQLISPDEALATGLVDNLADGPESVVAKAVEFAAKLTKLPPVAMNTTRLQAKSALLDSLACERDAKITTDYWFSDETQAAMQALVERLKK